VILPKLLDDLAMFRSIVAALAVLMLVGAVIGIAKMTTPKPWPFLWSAPSRWVSFWLQSITDWRLSILV
jgi:branched-chain amino acid transport system permease protein